MTPLSQLRASLLCCPVAALLSLPSLAGAQVPLFEVEKNNNKLMQVNDDGGLLVRSLGEDAGATPASGVGIRLMWDPARYALRAGAVEGDYWDRANLGRGSLAVGLNTTASGDWSTAVGLFTTASGYASMATGESAKATGKHATAMGFGTQASGERSVALGSNARAIGNGSFAYGDASSDEVVAATANMFAARAAGGFRFRTSADESTGCDLQAGSGTFNCTSSRLAKEHFTDVNGEAVLGKLAGMRIQQWRYRGTRQLHLGPTAEDFYAAFQLGSGPTTISTVDADGVNLVAVQALERRTAELKAENAALRSELQELRTMVSRLASEAAER